MTRRSFLQSAVKTILAMGFGGLFSPRSAFAADGIQHLRQMVTAHPAKTRMIQWDSPQQLENVRIEQRDSKGHMDRTIPAYTYLAMDDEVQFIYHGEIPATAGSFYRIIHTAGVTDWIPILPIHEGRAGTCPALFGQSVRRKLRSVGDNLSDGMEAASERRLCRHRRRPHGQRRIGMALAQLL